MVTEETIARAKQTFPKYTVYVCYRGGKTTAKTGDYYAERGKDYYDCTEALKKEPQDFKERQDEDLYNLVKEQENRKASKIDFDNLADRLRDIAYDIDDVIADLED